MYRMICASIALLVSSAVQTATADDTRVCLEATGDEAMAACNRLFALNPNDAHAFIGYGLGK